ncbi:MAG TPA: amidase [Polyangiaceae bacterium]
MDRRSFCEAGAAVAALLSLDGTSCAPKPPAAPSPIDVPHGELEEATIADLAAKMQRNETSAARLVEQYLERIDALDRKGPALSSVLELDPDAHAVAAALDAERRTRGPRGPLHGIPLLVKDNIDTAGRTHTTAGSLALAGAPVAADAEVVRRLRQAGAVLLGKANLSEWANIRSSHSTSGWSAVGGLTKNPYALDRNASGSSSGSAVAVAANLCAVALGTETDGSIVSPASICGIVGLKPTVGLVSRNGIVPIAHSQDTAGPMTRTVADAALVLSVIAGADARDPATEAQRGHAPFDVAAALRPGGARGKRIGVVRGFANIARSTTAIFDAAVEELRRLGAVVVDPVSLGATSKLDDPELEVLLYELKADMAAYLATRSGIPAKSLADLLKFDREHARDELRYFGQELFEQANDKGSLDSARYREALSTCRRLARDEGIDLALRTHSLDLLIAPTGGPAWLTDLVNGDAYTGSSSTPAAVAGYPSITVPAGALRGLPIGVSFFGAAFSEATLISVAHDFEQATRRRQKPQYWPTVPPS